MMDLESLYRGYSLLVDKTSVLKLRVQIADTFFLRNRQVIGHFYTNRDGWVCSSSQHQLQPSAVLHRVTSLHIASSPSGWKHVAVLQGGVTACKLLTAAELESLLEQGLPSDGSTNADLCCVQAFQPGRADARYLSTYGGTDGPSVTTIARRLTSKYPSLVPPGATKGSPASGTEEGGGIDDDYNDDDGNEYLQEGLLISRGLMEPRGQQELLDGALAAHPLSPVDFTSEEVIAGGGSLNGPPTTKSIAKEASQLVQSILSFVERAHGLRIQGMVVEFVAGMDGALCMTDMPLVTLDSQTTRGREATFTERWEEFLAGEGPPPAPQPPSKPYHAPGMLSSLTQCLDDPGGLTQRYFPAVSSRVACPRSPVRPSSAPPKSSFPSTPGSPGSMGTSRYKSPSRPPSAGYSQRNAASAARVGAGGNPTTRPATADAYSLWLQHPVRAADSLSSRMTSRMAELQERLQHQCQCTARVQSALHQLCAQHHQHSRDMALQVQEMKKELEKLRSRKGELEEEVTVLSSDRQSLRSQLATLTSELAEVRASLSADRETFSTAVRRYHNREDEMDEELASAQREREEATHKVQMMQRHLEEEGEVIEALRAQLVEYKQQLSQLQLQNKRPAGRAGPITPIHSYTRGSMVPAMASSFTAPRQGMDDITSIRSSGEEEGTAGRLRRSVSNIRRLMG